jgi:hypothetical protein
MEQRPIRNCRTALAPQSQRDAEQALLRQFELFYRKRSQREVSVITIKNESPHHPYGDSLTPAPPDKYQAMDKRSTSDYVSCRYAAHEF